MPGNRLADTIGDVRHGAVEKCRRRKTALPSCTFRIDGRKIPEDPVLLTAIGLGLRRACGRGDCPGDQVVRVPELLHPGVRNARHGAGVRRRKVGGQNRQPHDEYAHLRVGIRCEHRLDCGGPPQTLHSGRRQQDDDPRGISAGIELVLETADARRVQRGKRTLPRWRLAPLELPPAGRREYGSDDPEEDDTS